MTQPVTLQEAFQQLMPPTANKVACWLLLHLLFQEQSAAPSARSHNKRTALDSGCEALDLAAAC